MVGGAGSLQPSNVGARLILVDWSLMLLAHGKDQRLRLQGPLPFIAPPVSPTRERCKPSTEPGPATAARATYPQHELEGTVTVLGDIVAPVVSEEDWTGNANAGPTATATPTEP